MTLLTRVIAGTAATGALLLTALLPTTAQAATTAVFTGHAYGYNSYSATLYAEGNAEYRASQAGYSQCQPYGTPDVSYVQGTPNTYEAYVQVQCTA
ncbi:hypothetical protein ACFW1A_37810 [Kitasatospora sp. NPDC058965]|uniref:hypothetical protein n=1 Tax=Kitasatospora sp. NPDC058965 TaxID=3346682 RepID=UPI0036C3F6B8